MAKTPLERLRSLIPEAQDTSRDALLEALLGEAEEFLLPRLYRAELPDRLRVGQVRLALLNYNRMGAEGESAHSEGGVSRTIEALPEDLERWIVANRLLPGALRARRSEAEGGAP